MSGMPEKPVQDKIQAPKTYRMPWNEIEMRAFRKNPVGWMRDQIRDNLQGHKLTRAVHSMAQKQGIKIKSRDFFVILSYMALVACDQMARELAKCKTDSVQALKPNPQQTQEAA